MGREMDPTTLLSLMARTRPPADHIGVLEDEAEHYCRRRLRTLTTVEAATAVVARAVALDGGALTSVADLWWARSRDPLFRSRTADLGEEMLALAGRDPEPPLPRAVVIGMLAAEAGLAPGDLARMVGYDDVQAALADQDVSVATSVTAALFPDIVDLARRVESLTKPPQIPETGATLHELASAN